jgi:hypothetical protein
MTKPDRHGKAQSHGLPRFARNDESKPVIARSPSDAAIHGPRHCEERQPRANPPSRHCEERQPRANPPPRHCEERQRRGNPASLPACLARHLRQPRKPTAWIAALRSQ